MEKLVNISAKTPVRTLKVTIYGDIFGMNMSVGDIFKCICGRAIVDEILPNGEKVRLNMSNYNTVNYTPVQTKKIPEPVVVKKEKVQEETKPNKQLEVNNIKEIENVDNTTESITINTTPVEKEETEIEKKIKEIENVDNITESITINTVPVIDTRNNKGSNNRHQGSKR